MKFLAVIDYCEDKSKILEVRPAHREYLTALVGSGKLILGGPFTDDSGGILIYEAASAEEAEKLVTDDPFAKNGVFVTWKIRQWKLVMSNPEMVTPG